MGLRVQDAGREWRRRALAIAAIAGLAGAARLLYGPGLVGYDGMYSLAWGDDLAAGRHPDFEAPSAPTPHPLPIAIGVPLSLLDDPAARAVAQTAAFLALGALGWAAFRLGQVTFGAAAGVVLPAVLLTRDVVVFGALHALVDVPFLALVLWAAAAAVRDARRPVPVLGPLALAGLLRPEAWLLATAYLIWAWGRLDRRHRPASLALAAAPPLAWAAMDLAVTGSPVHSLTGTRSLAERLGRPTGLDDAITGLPGHLDSVLHPAVLWGGLAGCLLALRGDLRRAAVPLALGGLGLAAFLALGLAGLPLLGRYLLVPAAILALFCAVTLTEWSSRRDVVSLVVALAVAGGLVATAASQRRQIQLVREDVAVRRHLEGQLRALVTHDLASRVIDLCRPVHLPNSLGLPVVARALDLPTRDLRGAPAERPVRGSLLVPTRGDPRAYVLDPREPPLTLARPPRRFRPAAANRAFELWWTCRVSATG